MSFDKPHILALFLSLIFSLLFFAALLFINLYLGAGISFSMLAALVFGSFLIFFLSIRYAIEQFVYRKIKIIYKNIHKLKRGSKFKESDLEQKTDLDLAAREVAEWADERRNEIKELRTRENFRREFIGNISHELKTPIFNIQGYLLTLLDGALDDEEINRRYIKRANKSVDRMIAIIEDLEVIADLEGNRVKLNMRHYDLAEQIRDVFELLESAAKKRHIRLILKGDSDTILRVRADKAKMEQVLINLIGNSIKYGNENGYVEVVSTDMADKYRLDIKDNGLGIPEEDLPRVFERFYRVDKSRSREAGGTGLGLSIVKHIIESHKQTVSVSSVDEVGSTFSFTLQKAK